MIDRTTDRATNGQHIW